MKASKTVVILNELGLHARPAAKLAKLAQSYKARIYLKKAGRTVEAASILDVLSLACAKGAEVEILAEGQEAQEAVEAIASLLQNKDNL